MSPQEEIDTLREEVRQLKDMLGISGRFVYPPQIKLSVATGKLYCLLMQREVVSKDTAMRALYFDRADKIPGDRIIHMFVFRLRAELAQVGVEVKKKWREGYYLEAKDKARLKQLTERQAA
jgi:two-component system cell cycle response regulator CtrA